MKMLRESVCPSIGLVLCRERTCGRAFRNSDDCRSKSRQLTRAHTFVRQAGEQIAVFVVLEVPWRRGTIARRFLVAWRSRSVPGRWSRLQARNSTKARRGPLRLVAACRGRWVNSGAFRSAVQSFCLTNSAAVALWSRYSSP